MILEQKDVDFRNPEIYEEKYMDNAANQAIIYLYSRKDFALNPIFNHLRASRLTYD